MSTGTGVNVSKALVVCRHGQSNRFNGSKANAYAVVGSPTGVNVSKAHKRMLFCFP